jgi:2-hydroxychromene-2-carboxylate isomerase
VSTKASCSTRSSPPEIKRMLREATESAHALGVFGVPTVEVAGELFWGDDRLEDAAAHARSVGRAA